MGKTFYWLEKLLYLTVSFIAVVFFLTVFKVWAFDRNHYFLFTGDLESVIIVLVVSTGVAMLLERLWKWEVREIFMPKRNPEPHVRRGRR